MNDQYNLKAREHNIPFNFVSRKDILNKSNSDINEGLDSAEWTILMDNKPYMLHSRDFKEKLYIAELLKGKDTNIRSVYQPIVSLKDKRIWAYEGLTRFTLSGNDISPIKVFNDALDVGLIGELDWTCRAKVISSFPVADALLFVNISPSTANCEYFGTGLTDESIKRAGVSKEQVVLEITESGKVFDIETIKKIVLYYKNAGYRLALDDFGLGYNSLGLLFSIVNFIDFVKIPRELVHGISKSNIKLDLVRAMRDICFSNGKYIIVEGLEEMEDLEYIVRIGIDLAQGYLFSRPLETATLTDPPAFRKVVDNMHSLLVGNYGKKGRGDIKKILPVITVHREMEYRDFNYKLHDYLDRDSVLLIKADEETFVLDTFQYFGFISDNVMKDLLHYRSFDYVAAQNYPWLKKLEEMCVYQQEFPSIFDLYLFFENNTCENSNNDTVLIKENGRVAYYATRATIYKAMSDMLYIDRVSVNPLTGLPGNMAIEERIGNMLKGDVDFWIAYVDLDHFKAFNDYYGFASGDMMLKRLGSAMEHGLKEHFAGKFFLGHIGGDDFLFTIDDVGREEVEHFAPFFASTLSQSIVTLFNEEDRKQGFFEAMARDGSRRHFPLAAVSMAIASSSGKKSYIDISRTLSCLKKEAKMQEGTSYVIEEGQSYQGLFPDYSCSRKEI